MSIAVPLFSFIEFDFGWYIMLVMKDFIAFLDSGVGGISILREAVKLMPNEKFLYYGDSDNAPYGEKPTEVIRELMDRNVQYFIKHGAKCIVIACNTATGAAAKALRVKYPDIPIIGIEPAIKPAVIHNRGGHVVVMATPLTLKQEKFVQLFNEYKNDAEISLVPCSGLMQFVERGELSGDRLVSFLREKLAPAMTKKIDAVVLGCTHYPFIKQAVVEAIGYDVELDDGTLGTAKEIKRRIEQANVSAPASQKGEVKFLNSKGEKMIELSERLFNSN